MATTLAELETELTAIRTAKTAALTGGQSYSIAGRSFSRVNYKDLVAREKELLFEIARMSSEGSTHIDDFSRSRAGSESWEWGE